MNTLTNFNIGDKVQIYPGDTHKKIAKIMHIGKYGWEFKIVEGTCDKTEYKVGDIIFISHVSSLKMLKLPK